MIDPSKEHQDLKDYADGWMTERKHAQIPGFLKLAIPVIGLGAVAYLVFQRSGDIHSESRGPLVEQFNRVSHTSPAMSYTVAGLAFIYVIIVVLFALRTHQED